MSSWCVATMQSLSVTTVGETLEQRRNNSRYSTPSEETSALFGV